MTPHTAIQLSVLPLIDAGHQWTSDRLTAVDRLDAATPCDDFDLAALLTHLTESLQRFTAALSGEPAGELPTDTVAAAREALDRTRSAWETADMGRTYTLPIGELPAHLMALLSTTEIVVHGWDIGQATGEECDIPAELDEPLLEFSVQLLDDASRGTAFGAAVPGGDSPSQRLTRFLGRAG